MNRKEKDSDVKLELVQVLFRHGARTPIPEELSVFNDVDTSPYESLGLGALTAEGKRQEYEFGSFLRKRYDGFLSANYKSDEVYACSSNRERTQMSLQLVLAGLYPPTENAVWNPNLMWSPVPYFYVPEHQLDILLKYYERPEFRELVKQAYDSVEFKQNKIAKYKDFLDYVERNIGVNFDGKFFYVAFVYGVLTSHESMNLPLPDWYTPDIKRTFIEAMGTVYDGFAFTTEMKKLGAGPIIKTFIKNMNLDEQMINPRKIYLYSAHDGNLAIFTRALGIREFRYPPFGSALIFEKLRDSENQVFVRLLAWTGTGEILNLKVGNHEEFCPINDYLKIVQPVIPRDSELDEMLGEVDLTKLKELFFNDAAVKKL